MKKKIVISLGLAVACLTGCKQTQPEVNVSAVANEPEMVEVYQEEPEDIVAEYQETEEEVVEQPFRLENVDFALGDWYTEDYDPENNWALSYMINLYEDGAATCIGWRNADVGYFQILEDQTILITFDYCELDTPEGQTELLEGYSYTVIMTIDGDTAEIEVNGEDLETNLPDGKMIRQQPEVSNAETSEIVTIEDGEYATDETYTGEATSTKLTINTALHSESKPGTEYEKTSYEFDISPDCECVIYNEDETKAPISEKLDFVNDMLLGQSGLPIYLTIKDGQLVRVMITS